MKYTWKAPKGKRGEFWEYETWRGRGNTVVGEIHSVETKYNSDGGYWHLYDMMRKNPKTGMYFHDYISEWRLNSKVEEARDE